MNESVFNAFLYRIWFFLCGLAVLEIQSAEPVSPRERQMREYRESAMGRDGNAERGRVLFHDENRAACSKCHSVDGKSSKAGPDLMSAGDKFPRRELVRSIHEPSAAIAVGYGTTIIETKAEEEFQGVVKSMTATSIRLMGADGKVVEVSVEDVKNQRGSQVSLMPEGLDVGLSRDEFTDLIEYLVSLKQPESALSQNRGTPASIPELRYSVAFRPLFSEALRFPHNYVQKPGDIRNGLVWFGQLPGSSNQFIAGHQTGKVWLLEKNGTNESKSLFADITKEIFNERGPNGLLGIAFHPKFRQNRRYFLKHQVFEGGKIVTTVVERTVLPDFRTDSGISAKRIWQVIGATQDHTGGCIGFGPDGFLYIAMGDTGPQQDPRGHGQDLSTHLGKILRIDVDRSDSGQAYGIPVDNPFAGLSGFRKEIWAYGFREPWRFSFDSLTGELWVGDVGQDRVEEVAIVRQGENHGWNVFEGFEPFSNQHRRNEETFTSPIFAYRRKFGNSVTGGYVYRGHENHSFHGVYIFGDYTSRRVFGLKQENREMRVVRQIGVAPQSIASFGCDQRGEIFVVGYEGMVYRLDLTGARFDGELNSNINTQ